MPGKGGSFGFPLPVIQIRRRYAEPECGRDGRPPGPGAELTCDLAVLCDGPMVDVQISFDGGLIAMRSNDKLVFQEAAEARWRRLDGQARARLLSSWIHAAAEKYRELLRSRLGNGNQAEVA